MAELCTGASGCYQHAIMVPNPVSHHLLRLEVELPLESGQKLVRPAIAYESWGELNATATNAILICHALTGDQYVTGTHPVTGKPGWWTRMVGAGRPIDPARHFIICMNVIGGCMGSEGPASSGPDGTPWGLDFPVITIADMVRAQAAALDALGVGQLLAVVGGSMGGMQALQWAASYPERVRSVVAIATTARHSAQNIAFHEVGRQAILADPQWHGGAYYQHNATPTAGLAVARMTAHITYLSEAGLTAKFGRRLQDRADLSFGFEADFQIESYLRYQGSSFVDRFDANSYLYITRAMDYFDLAAPYDGQLASAFAATKARFCVISFDSDWLYPTAESKTIVQALVAAGRHVSFVEIDSPHGHDSFLLDSPTMYAVVDGFLKAGEGLA